MKNMITMAILSLAAQSVFAGTTLLNCVVPVEQGSPTVTFTITKEDDVSVDYVLMTLTENNTTKQYFNQLEKGEATEQIKSGTFNTLAITEGTTVVAGVIKNTGIISLNLEQGQFAGVFIANGNIYPLACQAGK